MKFEPDILAYRPDSSELALAAAVRLSPNRSAEFHRSVARYMLGMNCPVAILVTPQELTVYHNRFLSRNESSIAVSGPVPSGQFSGFQALLESTPAGMEAVSLLFQDAVRDWLRFLAWNGALRGDESHTSDLVATYIVPAVAGGEIRAAAPKEWIAG